MPEPSSFELVDTHVHLWDLSHSWYPDIQKIEVQEGHEVGLGDMAGLRRDYLVEHYLEDSACATVRKVVHVSAVTEPRAYLHEAGWLDGLAARTGIPAAVIGSVEPADEPARMAGDIDAQAASPLLRGVRVMFGLDPESAGARRLVALLAERGLVFEIVAHPDDAAAYARLVEPHPELTCVLEHALWPQRSDTEGFRQWRQALGVLASIDHLHCKISGLAMALHSFDPDRLRPWVEGCIDAFGIERCVVGSNFPVDRLYGSFQALMDSYLTITAGLGESDARRLYVSNAEALYRV
ncbi:MAG TPA: amidohydrolase family protein [Acidimicrobiales bacterium]|nr:amidohydrolase family protein [Acidimicrobiales bacterium]